MSYSDITRHRPMVFDTVRNLAYTRAMSPLITADTKVMDLGAGLGVLGLIAGHLGAGQVHMVEPAISGGLLREIAAANSLDQVVCHESTVEQLLLEEKVDLILSVFTGNFLLTEDLLPSLFYARDKFLCPGGKLVPDCGRMIVMPVSMPSYYARHVSTWENSQQTFAEAGLPQIDFERVGSFAHNTLFHDSARNFAAEGLGPATLLMQLDFYTATSAACDHQIELLASETGTCHGFLGWLQARLGDTWLSSGPDDAATHWKLVFMPLSQPLELERGDKISFALKHPEFGDWTWTTSHKGEQQRNSTFLSEPVSLQEAKKHSQYYQPELNGKGLAARWLVNEMNGQASMIELGARLYQQYPEAFASVSEADAFVARAVKQWS